MNGIELDRRMRAVLGTVTRETCLQATLDLVELGFPTVAAWNMVEKTVLARELHEEDQGPKRKRVSRGR